MYEDLCSGCGIPITFGHCDCSLVDLYEKLEELDITDSYFDENEDICPEEDEVFDIITKDNDREKFICGGDSMTYMEAKVLREEYSDMNQESWIVKQGTWDS